MSSNATAYLPGLIGRLPKTDSSVTSLSGTMAFVDISGFTAMSERLAAKGKIGAEELSEVLNRIFSDLLTIAANSGGDLIKFGGDALLLFFDGKDHEIRATDSAIRMRRKLTHIGRVKTSVGVSRLRMSMGIASGEFLYCVSGRSHRELIVFGPAATATVSMESAAEAGDILIDPSTAKSLPSGRLGASRAGGILLRNIDGKSVTDFESARLEIPDAETYLSPLIREHVFAGEFESEHRAVSVAFIHFSDVDSLLNSGDPTRVAAEINELITSIQNICEGHGVTFLGTDIAEDGGKIILVAGAPTSFGNNEERILQATRSSIDLKTSLMTRAGVNFGHVFTGDVGSRFRRTYTILGDSVNLAARLMAKAEPGGILAPPPMLERSKTKFRSVPLEPFKVKGKAHPVRALSLGEVFAVAGKSSIQIPLIGRDPELKQIRRAIEQSRHGKGALIEIAGEAGIGKSRLVEEALSGIEDKVTFRAQCAPYATTSPYFPMRWILRQVAGIPGDLDSEKAGHDLTELIRDRAPHLIPWIPLLAIPFDGKVESTPEVERLAESFIQRRIHETVFAALETLIPSGAVLVFEDVHWMDDASAGLLHHLQNMLPSKAWVCIVTRRSEQGGFHPAEGSIGIHLHPLTNEAAERVLRAAASRSFLPQELSALSTRANGNPLFLTQLANSEADGHLPDTVESLMASKIDRLHPSHRRLVREASVIGMIFNADVLRLTAGGERDVEAILENYLIEFIEPVGNARFRFRHALLRDAAYEGLSFMTRKTLHKKVGETLETLTHDVDSVSELLSLHFYRAGLYAKGWTYSLRAGKRSKERFANHEAEAFLLRAIECSKRLGDVDSDQIATVWSDLAYVTKVAGKLGNSVHAYRHARKLVQSDPARIADYLFREGEVLERSGRFSQALGCYTRGLKVLGDRTQTTNTRIRLLIATAFVRFRQGKYRACLRIGEKALEEAIGIDDRAGMAHIYSLLHLTYVTMGDSRRAEYRDRALPIYEEIGDLEGQGRVLNNLGLEAYSDGRWAEAMDYFHRAREVHAKTGDVVGRVEVTVNLGELLSDAGNLDEAKDLFKETLELARASSYRLAEGVALSDLGRAHTRSGDFATAAERLGEASLLLEELNAKDFVLEAKARLAEMHLLAGEPKTALALASQCADDARAFGALTLLPLVERIQGLAQAELGEIDKAESMLRSSLMNAQSTGSRYEQAMTMSAMGSLLDDADLAMQSEELFRSLGIMPIQALPLRNAP